MADHRKRPLHIEVHVRFSCRCGEDQEVEFGEADLGGTSVEWDCEECGRRIVASSDTEIRIRKKP